MPTDEITQKVTARYAKAASTGEQMCCPTIYDMGHLKTFIPEEVLKISYGCGTPAGLKTVQAGETVLDIGSGGGIDCFEASRLVGPTGHVIGIDMTDTMLEIARKNAAVVADESWLSRIKCGIPQRPGRCHAGARRHDRSDHLELCHQSRPGQAESVSAKCIGSPSQADGSPSPTSCRIKPCHSTSSMTPRNGVTVCPAP